MPEDEDDSEEFDLKEWKRKNGERRKERLKHASYRWAETVREAGELYRELEQIEAVSEELDLSKDTAQEALVIYNLIFDQPVDSISGRTAIGGRAYFSLERDVEEVLEDCDEEQVKEVVREFVGAVYLQNDLEEQEVGSPPENSTPPSNVDFSKLKEAFSDNFASEIQKMAVKSGVSSIPDSVLESQTTRMAAMLNPAIEEQNSLARGIAESINTQHRETMQDVLSRSFPPIARQIQRQQEVLTTSVVSSVTGLNFPEPLLVDLANLQPGFSALAAATASSTTTNTESSSSASSPSTTVEAESVEPDPPVEHPVDPSPPTTGTAPTNPELVLELSVEITKAILTTEQVRSWFEHLSRRQQIGVVQLLLMSSILLFTQNPAWTSLAGFSSEMVRQMIMAEGREE